MTDSRLTALGWNTHFASQVADTAGACRVAAVHRAAIEVIGVEGPLTLPVAGRFFQGPLVERPTVGDWVLLDEAATSLTRVLERRTLIKRAGPDGAVQPIAANVDTLFIVTSCNQEFNVSRLERYVAIALEAGVMPVVVLTKIDLAEDVGDFERRAASIRPGLMVECVNALDRQTIDGIRAWCKQGQTAALVGSSGVGKSTLLNALAGTAVQQTAGVRTDDDKGRHTTTHRSLHMLPNGGLVVDSPGMRELRLVETAEGVAELFEDVETLVAACRFSDCSHASEPGCAVQDALTDGTLDARRLENYFKLKREEQRNTESVAERHTRDRQFSKMVKRSKRASEEKRR